MSFKNIIPLWKFWHKENFKSLNCIYYVKLIIQFSLGKVAAESLQSCPTLVQPHRQQLTKLPRPWDSPGKKTGVGCHFLLQCMKVKSEREVAQSCPTLSDPMDCSPPGSSVHGIFQARVLETTNQYSYQLFYGWGMTHLLVPSYLKNAYCGRGAWWNSISLEVSLLSD